MDYIIQTDELSFSYANKKLALDKLSINVPKGSIYGFLGPNGAGKSTTMSLLTGILDDQTGSIKLFGQAQKEQFPYVFSKIGSLVEFPALYHHLSGYENLLTIAELRQKPTSRVDELLDLVDLSRDKKRKSRQYSLGMKQRLAIAMALMGDPELLLLDEPANGLDPNGIVEVRKLLQRLADESNVSIFVSSHILAEIEKLCTHVGIINLGQLKFEGTMADLAKLKSVNTIHIAMNNAEQWIGKIDEKADLVSKNLLRLKMEKSLIPAFIQKIAAEGAEIFEISQQDGLEEWFMDITDNKE